MGFILKATWTNKGIIKTYWCPPGQIDAAYKAFPVVGRMRVELEVIKKCDRRPSGVDHHIKEYL